MVSKAKNFFRIEILVITLVGGFLLLLVGGASILLIKAYQSAYDVARVRATSNVGMVVTNVEWLSETGFQLLQRIDDYVGPNEEPAPPEAVGFLKNAVSSLPGSAQVYLVRANGSTELTTDPDIMPIDIRDRAYFKVVQNGEKTYISPMIVSRLNGDQIFVMSKRIERKGRFVAAAIVSFNSDLIKQVWMSLKLDPTSSVVVVKESGDVVARYPAVANRPNISDTDLFTQHLPKAPTGTYETISKVDGVRRIVAYQKVMGTDLITTATIGYDFAFRSFYRFAWSILAITVPLAVFLAFMGWRSYQMLHRDTVQHEALQAAYESNKMMFREIHHRVKNNLQVVSSLVNLQKIDAAAKRDMSQRIGAMVAVHEQIYENDQFALVDASNYIPSIVENVVKSYGRQVEVEYDLEHIEVERDQALPLGLITNEVVSNAIKHGLPSNGPAILKIKFKKAEDKSIGVLQVSDNGEGFDPEFSSKGMGMRLLIGLAAQLQGTFHYRVDEGTIFELRMSLPAEAA